MENQKLLDREKFFSQLRGMKRKQGGFEKFYPFHLLESDWFWETPKGAKLSNIERGQPEVRTVGGETKVILQEIERKKGVTAQSLPKVSKIVSESEDKSHLKDRHGQRPKTAMNQTLPSITEPIIQIVPPLKPKMSEKIEPVKSHLVERPVVFVTDYKYKDGIIFNDEQWDLFEKMINAMGLKKEHYAVLPLFAKIPEENNLGENPNENEILKLKESLLQIKPTLILALGAKVSTALLERQERLSQVHGLFIEKTFEVQSKKFSTRVVPLFHPDFLLINPNMKKVVWLDLKKVINYLGKILP